MSTAQSLPYHLVLRLGKCLKGQDLINFLAMNRNLTQDLVRYSLETSVTQTRLNEDFPPVTHAIKTGNTELFAEVLQCINSCYPEGWSWFQFYDSGVSWLLHLAAAHNLESLKCLTKLYPLKPAVVEQRDHDNPQIESLYRITWSSPMFAGASVGWIDGWIDSKNQELLDEAVLAGKLDCVSFLLRAHQPPLFRRGVSILRDIYLASADTMEFLIDNGALFPPIALHKFATLSCLPDPRIFDVAVKHGFGVDSLPQDCISTFLREAYTPLLAACYVGQPTAVEALLRLGANPNGLGRPWIRPVEGTRSKLDFYSPNPILALLFSHQPFESRDEIAVVGRRLLSCFDLLVRFGASMPLDDDMCQHLLRRFWVLVCTHMLQSQHNNPRLQVTYRPYFQNAIGDPKEGADALFSVMETADVAPWDELCDRIVELGPEWKEKAGESRGKGLLMKLFHDYQAAHGDLPGRIGVESEFRDMGRCTPFRTQVGFRQ
jgi:hypothetical protein